MSLSDLGRAKETVRLRSSKFRRWMEGAKLDFGRSEGQAMAPQVQVAGAYYL